MEIYVGKITSSTPDGSIDNPFGSIDEAKKYIENINTNEKPEVIIKGGRYHFKDTLRNTKNDKSAVYKAAAGEKVYFDGGIIIDQSLIKKVCDNTILDKIIDEKAKEHIYEADLSCFGIELGKYGARGFRHPYIPAPNELFINSVPQKIAAYPKDGYIPLGKVIDSGSIPMKGDFSMRGGIFGYDDDRGDKWVNAEDAYICGFFANCYADDTIKVESINIKDRTIKLKNPGLNGLKALAEHRWRIVNLLEEIGEEGEYYIDRGNKKLYFYPDCDITNALIQLSVLTSPMISFINASNISFENIIFENSRGSGVYIEGGEGISVNNCEFRNLGIVAVQIGQGITPLPDGLTNCHGVYDHDKIKPQPMSEGIGSWHEYIYEYAAYDGNGGKNHLISGCDIHDIGAGGIMLGGGNRKKLIPANNKVYNTHIHNVNRLDLTYKGAVNIWGVGNVISHCELDDLEGFAVYIHGNDHLIEYSKIHNVAKSISDGAAIYMGRDPSEVGNKIRYNFIYDIKNPHSYDMYGFTAIYFDDNAIYNEVYGNYFYDIVQKGRFFFSTIHWNNGGQTSVANNILIDCYPGLDPNTYDNSYERMHTDETFITRITASPDDLRGVDITDNVWKEHYPYLYDTYTSNYNHTTLYYNNFVCSNQYQNFVDENPSHLNFKLKQNSYLKSKYAKNVNDRVRGIKAEKVMFEEIDFDSIGLLKKN